MGGEGGGTERKRWRETEVRGREKGERGGRGSNRWANQCHPLSTRCHTKQFMSSCLHAQL